MSGDPGPISRPTDDRDAPSATWQGVSLAELLSPARPMDRDEFRALFGEIERATPPEERPADQQGWFTALLWIAGIIATLTVLRIATPIGVALLIAGALVQIIWLYRERWRLPSANDAVIRNALLAHRRCAACAQDLTGLDPQPDACTICPECGAAWRLPNSDSTD